jgi:hypothetical protein
MCRCHLIAAGRIAAHFMRAQVQGAQAVAIGGVAGASEGNSVTGRKQQGEGHSERSASAHGDGKALRRNAKAICIGIVARQPLFERHRFPVTHWIAIEHCMRGGNGCFWRAGRGLAKFHMIGWQALRRAGVSHLRNSDGVKRLNRRAAQTRRDPRRDHIRNGCRDRLRCHGSTL